MPLGASRLAYLAKPQAAGVAGSSLQLGTGNTSTQALSDSDYSIGTGDFTIEAWAYLTSATASGYVCSHGTSFSDPSNIRLGYDLNTTNVWSIRLGGTWYDSNVGGVVDTWVHLAVVRSSGTVNFYIDGVKDTNIGTSGDVTFSTNLASRPIAIGNLSYAAISPFQGYVDEFRISDTARYTGNFTPSSTAFTDDADTLTLLHCEDDGGGDMDDDISVRGSGGINYTLSGAATFNTSIFKF